MIRIVRAKCFGTDELHKLDQVVELANKVLYSPQFRFMVEGTPSFVDSKDTGHQVYAKIMECDMGLVLGIYTPPWYKRWSSAIARENPDGSIEFRRSYFQSADLATLADTMIHELCHKAGYSHSFWPNATRDKSVPYAVGIMAEEVAKVFV